MRNRFGLQDAGRASAPVLALLLMAAYLPLVAASPAAHPSPWASAGTSHLDRVATDARPAGASLVPGWDPSSGRSSPGTPSHRLMTTPLLSSGCSPSYRPAWLAYDPLDQEFWVAAPSSCLESIQVSSNYSAGNVTASYAVGTDPFGVAVDTSTNDVFVTNTGSDNVTVISATTGETLANISVGSEPLGIAYDQTTQALYVANNGSDNLSVISGSTLRVTASISVGVAPVGIAADPASGQVFVANSGSDTVSVIAVSNGSVVATVAVGSTPYGVAVDNTSDRVYVTNEGSNNLSAIDAGTDALVATIPVSAPGMDLQGIAYVSPTGELWVGAGYSYAVRVNATSEQVDGYFGVDPSGVAYAPDTGYICLTNTANFTFECLVIAAGYVSPTITATFLESGLPGGATWTVEVNASWWAPNETTDESSSTDAITFALLEYTPSSVYHYAIPTTDGWTAVPSQGDLPFTNSSVTINVTFASFAPTFPANFTEVDLPSGTFWSVNVAGTPVGASTNEIVVYVANGTYAYQVSATAGYVPTPASGYIVVSGGPVAVRVNFTQGTPPSGNFTVAFVESGLPSGTFWTVQVNLTSYGSTSTRLSFTVAPGTYAYRVGAVARYFSSIGASTFTIGAANLTISLTFTPAYEVTFEESGLPAGTTWTVSLGSDQVTSTLDQLWFIVPAGPVVYTVASLQGWVVAPAGGTLVVQSNLTVFLNFTVTIQRWNGTYAVTFQEDGLPAYTTWTLVVNGSFVVATGAATTVWLPNGTYGYSVASVPGFFSDPSSGAFQVLGGPETLTITFLASSGGGTPPVGNLSASDTLLLAAGIGVVAGGIGGLLTGFVFSRRRDPPRPT